MEVADISSEAVSGALRSLGLERMRPLQEEVVGALFAGKDVLGVLPTSAGKTLCFQLPAMCRPGPVVVVSPLVALMRDQVRRCREAGIVAHALTSHCTMSEKRQIGEDCLSGQARILYVSPERLQGLDKTYFGDHLPQLVAIDEAHCIAEWGHDFRPAFRRVGRSLSRFGAIQKLVLTATATPEVVEEIASVVGMGAESHRIVRSPDRPNIRYAMAGSKVPITRMLQFAELPVLVYGSRRRSVEEAARELRSAGYRAAHYHADMPKADRTAVQEGFRSGQYDAVVATCAFGMGIDHPGIRAVLHLEMPTSLEAYVQESGRAGRDGGPSVAICRATVETLDMSLKKALEVWPEPRTVRAFHQRILRLFEQRAGRWEGAGRLQVTEKELGTQLGFKPDEAGACVRVLSETGVLHQTPPQERTVRVAILKGATVRLGSRVQADALRRIAEEADESGAVEGTKAFFEEVVGVEKATLEKLSVAGAVRYEWPDRCQVIELVPEGRIADLDEAKLMGMRARVIRRIQACRDYVACPGCRREFLLEWFGAGAEGPPLGVCCDRCNARSRLGAAAR